MLDIVFVNPPRPYLVNPHAQAPLGILYLAAACELAGQRVAVVNAAGWRLDATPGRIPPAHCYGLTGTFLDVEAVNYLAGVLREQHPHARILVGGPISLSADKLDRSTGMVVVHGEADEVIDKLVRGEVAECGEPDIASLPWPARHLWAGPFGGNVFLGARNWFGGGSATVMTSRGCPMSCAFCAGPALCSRRVRYREHMDVVLELERLAVDYGVRQYRFSDEFMTANRHHLAALCDGMKRSKVLRGADGCAWRCSVGVNPHDEEMFEAMRIAGCREISVGVESADPNVLRVLQKRQTVAAIEDCLRTAKRAGLGTRALMMVATPGTTEDTPRLTLEFLERNRRSIDWLAITVFEAIPGCAVAAAPAAFGCRILTQSRSICVRGPDGDHLDPAIDVDGISYADLAAGVRVTVDKARDLGILGSG